MIVPILFFCSGATALVYEVLWSKHLSLMFGSTIHAQTVVLAVFMGGLAAGNWIFGRRSKVIAQPLGYYGYLEIAIGLYAFFFPSIFHWADRLFIALGSSIAEQPAPLLALKGFLSFLLLIGPTVLMGGTLPLLAVWLERSGLEASRLAARFYSINSLGAVTGAGVAGFFLVRELGMTASLQLTAIFNFAIGLAAIALARKQPLEEPAESPATASASTPSPSSHRPELRFALGLVAVTGGVALGMEVLASRALALLFGASLHAFAIVLMAFILGIGLGSSVIASRKINVVSPGKLTFILLLGAGLYLGAFVISMERWVILYSQAKFGLAANQTGYLFHQLLAAIISILILGIPAALVGAVLPLQMRLVAEGRNELGGWVGRLLSFNTVGAVLGVLVTGFVLMPGAGLRGSLIIMSSLLLIAALAIGRRENMGGWLVAAGGALVALLLMSTATGQDWRHALGSGIFRLRGSALNEEILRARRGLVRILYYKDAPDATVSVETSMDPAKTNEIVLRINGKSDASTKGDLSTQYLLGHLPMLARPQSKEIFILGLGSGITAGAVLTHPVDQVTVAENCRPVVEAAEIFGPWNRRVLANPKIRLRPEDARTVLKLSPKRYDVIISEPSNPWLAGIGSVFSEEFYQLCASRLQPDGVMAQWFHMYEMHDQIVNLVIRTFSTVFPHFEIWDTLDGDIILLGSQKPWESSPRVFAETFQRPAAAADLAQIGLRTPEAVLARQIASQATAWAIPGDGPRQTDEFPVLEYAAPRAFFIGQPAMDLFLFDERTHQSWLAPQKTELLKSLSEETVLEIFSEFPSCNRELVRYLKWRAEQRMLGSTNAVFTDDPFLPVAFRPAASYPLAGQSQHAGEKRMQEAIAAALRDPAKASDAAAVLETTLAAQGGALGNNQARFAAFAARVRLQQKDYARAKQNVQLGLGFSAEDAELLYLLRIVQSATGEAAPLSLPQR